ncbi:MAG: cell division protein [Phycisphaerae bacterium]|nr:cell division protein [Phycisphaerae bacterium]MBM92120.1 cell division protein [Phycisphaerae bacterium]HCT46382.1 cell division protein [Phycisphaerales bacterium]|tara:strand:+ start:331 stop:822 length:492 start_codon:yes stop_codon:yes gene_type:complete
MPIIRTTTTIQAPIQRVFDLARSIDAHVATTTKSGEKAVAGRKTGLIEYAESVTWEAKHLGRTQRLKVQITEFDRPNQFVDEMVTGAFRSLRHVHRFKPLTPDQTEMTDELVFKAPMGPLGTIAEKLFLTGYMQRFLEERNQELKQIAESQRWKEFVPETSAN